MSERHNGWTNYETWVVNLWMDNQRGQQDYWAEEARSCYRDARDEKDIEWTQRERAIFDLAAKIEGEHRNAAADMLEAKCFETGPFADLLNASLAEVNWREIAGSWVDAHCTDCEEV